MCARSCAGAGAGVEIPPIEIGGTHAGCLSHPPTLSPYPRSTLHAPRPIWTPARRAPILTPRGRRAGARGEREMGVLESHVGFGLPAALRRRLAAGEWLRTAHRGAPTVAPGNSAPAIAAAAERGVDLIEIDLRATADGRLVLWHDDEIAGPGGVRLPIATSSLRTLRRIDIGGGERIVELAEAIEIARGRAGLLLDLKAERLARPVVETVRRRDFGPVVVCGHYWGSLQRIKRFAPEIGVAFTVDRAWRRLLGGTLIDRAADAVAVNWRLIDRAFVRHYHARGIAVLAWTIDDPARMGCLLDLGVDGLTSNRPDLFAALATRVDGAGAATAAG